MELWAQRTRKHEDGVCCAQDLMFCSSYGDGSDSNSRGGGKNMSNS